jgi:hypothetical protein
LVSVATLTNFGRPNLNPDSSRFIHNVGETTGLRRQDHRYGR